MNKRLILYVLPVLILGIFGCSNTKESTPRVEQLAEMKEEKEYGTKDSPASIDEKITVDFDYYLSENSSEIAKSKIEIDISNYILGEEAYNELLASSPLNKEAPEGYQWIILDASITMLEGSEDSPFSPFPLIESISEEGESSPSVPIYVLDNKIRDSNLYNGETISGKIAGYIPINEPFTIKYRDNINSAKEIGQNKDDLKIELYFEGVI